MQSAIATHPELIQVEKDKFTTQAALNMELNTIRLMQQGQGAVGPIATERLESALVGALLSSLQPLRAGNPGEHRTRNLLEAGCAGFEQGFEELAAALEPHLEPLASAIADYHEQRDLLRYAGDLANASTAVNLGLEQLEQSAKKRAGLTAALDRLNRALGEKVGQLISFGGPNSGESPEQVRALEDIPGEVTKEQHPLLCTLDGAGARQAEESSLCESDDEASLSAGEETNTTTTAEAGEAAGAMTVVKAVVTVWVGAAFDR